MKARDVERIVRDIVADYGYPFDVLAVSDAPRGWQVSLRHRSEYPRTVDHFHLEEAPLVRIRAAIKGALDDRS